MKRNNIIYNVGVAAALMLSFASCDSYLDEMPDNRAEVDSEEKIVSLLTSAYPQNGSYMLINETMSDNIDDMGERYEKYGDRFLVQAYSWDEMTEFNNDGVESLWATFYSAVASANTALEAIEELGGATTTTLKEAKAEALLCRAYGHFVLVNEFCNNYNSATSTTDLGIPYMTKPETSLSPAYERGTVAEVYENIDKDIQEALPLLGDTHLDVPKYHFNTQAAYAFAARFYLFYEKWDKAAEYATQSVGSSAKTVLRDWDEMESYGITNDISPRTNLYIDASANCNFLLCTAISSMGLFTSNYLYWTKYSHNTYISKTETYGATNVWGGSNLLRCPPMTFSGGAMDRVIVAKLPYLFEELDPVAKTGYYRTVYPPFKGDLTLLERAEAYVMMREYDKAAADLTTWMQNWTKSRVTLTPEDIKSFFDGLAYYTPFAPTMKKHLNPAFSIDEEGSIQESMLQCVLSFKRIETVYEGLRWFDIRRYGIKVYRRTMNEDGEPETVTDSLESNDVRRSVQLPDIVLNAGMVANPR